MVSASESSAAEAVPKADRMQRRLVMRLVRVASPAPVNRMKARSRARPGLGRYHEEEEGPLRCLLGLLVEQEGQGDAGHGARPFQPVEPGQLAHGPDGRPAKGPGAPAGGGRGVADRTAAGAGGERGQVGETS